MTLPDHKVKVLHIYKSESMSLLHSDVDSEQRDMGDESKEPPDGKHTLSPVSKSCVVEEQTLERKSSLKRRKAGARPPAHSPLSRKISFPPEEMFQSSVADGDNVELRRVLHHHITQLDINKANHAGVTALHQAVLNKNLDGVKLLLVYGCHVDVADAHGFTPLHTASACGHMSIASMLILHGAHVFGRTHSGDVAADLAKDSSMGRMLQDEMIHQLHGQQQQLQQHGQTAAPATQLTAAVYWLLACVAALCLWMWNSLKQSYANKSDTST